MSSSGPPPALVEHLGVRVPSVGAAHEHGRGRTHRCADRAFRDQLPTGLVRAGEERVGRASEAQAEPLRLRDELARFIRSRRKRLLGIDVFGGGESCGDDGRVRVGRREVENQVDFGVGDQLADTERTKAVPAAKAAATSASRSAQATGRQCRNAPEPPT